MIESALTSRLPSVDPSASPFGGAGAARMALEAQRGSGGEGPRAALASSMTGAVKTQNFQEALREAERKSDPGERAEAKSRAVAQEFVSVAFIQPLLKQLRDTNQAWGPFQQGQAEKQFGAMLDAEYASRISRASTNTLVERLAQDLRRDWGGVVEKSIDRTA